MPAAWNGHGNPGWVLLGLYVASVGVNALRPQPSQRPVLATPWVHGMGFAIGMVEMLFGTSGPLAAAWLRRRLGDVHALRASTPVIILVSASAVLVSMGWGDCRAANYGHAGAA